MTDIYTDGSSKLGYAGWAFCDEETGARFSGRFKGTNNQAELTAIKEAILFAIREKRSEVRIVSDSTYCINSLTVWYKGWIRDGWPDRIKNKEIIQEILSMHSAIKVEYKWVKGHSGNYFNEIVDQLAQSEASLLMRCDTNNA